MTIGERIKELRLKKNMTQKQLAAATGLSEISIRKYETDERRPKIETIRKIATALDSYMGYFLNGYFEDYIDEIKEDFSNSEVKIPKSLQIEVDDKYSEQLKEAINLLAINRNDPTVKAHARQILKDVAIGLGHNDERSFMINSINININDLNEKGLNKVLGLTQDLILIKNYLVESSDAENKTHLLPNAAHEQTDIEVTDEMRQHDDDIMNDPDF